MKQLLLITLFFVLMACELDSDKNVTTGKFIYVNSTPAVITLRSFDPTYISGYKPEAADVYTIKALDSVEVIGGSEGPLHPLAGLGDSLILESLLYGCRNYLRTPPPRDSSLSCCGEGPFRTGVAKYIGESRVKIGRGKSDVATFRIVLDSLLFTTGEPCG